MASTYSDLKVELIGTGEQSGTWGDTTNTNLGTALGEAITGSADVTFASGDVNLTMTDTNTTQTARNLRLNLTGTVAATQNLYLSTGCNIEKLYLINNGLSYAITVRNKILGTPSGTSVSVPAGKSLFVYNTGTDIVDAVTYLSSLTLGTPLPVASGGTGASDATTARSNLSAAKSGANSDITSLSGLTTPLSTPQGGTGLASFTSGGAVYATSTSALTTGTLPLTAGGTGATTDSGARTNLGLGTIATLNTVNLGTNVTGNLPVANLNGGTGAASNTYWRGDGTWATVSGASGGTVTSVAASTSGASFLSVSGSPITSSGTLAFSYSGTALPVANGGTGNTTYTNGQLLIGNTTGNTLTKATLTEGTGISITNGAGSITIAATGGTGTVTSVSGTGTVSGLTLTGTVTSSGSLTLGGTLSAAASAITSGTLATARGGTGLSSFTSGGAVYASSTSALTTGTLPVASGGTGTASTINYGFKNRVINGTMSYDQRNLGAATGTATANPWLVDRWQLQTSSLTGKFNGGRNYVAATAPTGFLYNIGVTSQSAYSPAAGESFDITQVIEGFNIQDLAWGTASAQSITLSFYVYVSAAGTYAGAIRNAAKNRSYVFTFTVPSGSQNTWYQVTPITIAGDTSGTWDTGLGAGIWLSFSLGAYTTFETASPNTWLGSNYTATTTSVAPVSTNGATFSISGVQLERGATATTFDSRSIGQEFTLCQRYFQALRADSEFDIVMMGAASSTANQANLMCPLQTPLRTSPTVTYSNMLLYKESTGTGFSFTGGIKNYLANLANQVVFELTTTTSASFTAGSAVTIATAAGSSGYVFLDADTW